MLEASHIEESTRAEQRAVLRFATTVLCGLLSVQEGAAQQRLWAALEERERQWRSAVPKEHWLEQSVAEFLQGRPRPVVTSQDAGLPADIPF
jgi:hypothetical protein